MRVLLAIIAWLIGIIEFLLAIRILLVFFRVSGGIPIVGWVYSVTASLIKPFVGLIPVSSNFSGFVVDWRAIVALIVVSLIGTLLRDLSRQSSY